MTAPRTDCAVERAWQSGRRSSNIIVRISMFSLTGFSSSSSATAAVGSQLLDQTRAGSHSGAESTARSTALHGGIYTVRSHLRYVCSSSSRPARPDWWKHSLPTAAIAQNLMPFSFSSLPSACCGREQSPTVPNGDTQPVHPYPMRACTP